MSSVNVSEWRSRVGYLPPVLDALALGIVDERGIGEATAVAEAVVTVRDLVRSGRTSESNRTIPSDVRGALRETLDEWELLRACVAVEGMPEGKWAEIDVLARELVEAADSMAKATVHEPVGKPGGPGLWKHKGWQLPAYIQHIANDIREKRGMTTSRAIAVAIGAVKRWARGGGKVDANTKAAAAKALAEWEKLKAQAHATEGNWNSMLVRSVDRLQHIVSEVPMQRTFAHRFAHRGMVIESVLGHLAERNPVALKSAQSLLGDLDGDLLVVSAALEGEMAVCRVLAEALGYGPTPIRSKRGKFHGMHGTERAVKKRTHIPNSDPHPVLDSINAKGSLTETGSFTEDLHPRVAAGAGGGQFAGKGGQGQPQGKQPPQGQGPQGQGQSGGGGTVQQQLDQRLTQLGYQAGGQSLKEFQSANGLAATGVVDQPTTDALRKADPADQARKQIDSSLQFGKANQPGAAAAANRAQVSNDQLQSIGFADDASGVAMFQKQYDLPVTGKLDPSTMAAITTVYGNNARGSNSKTPDFTGIKGAGAKIGHRGTRAPAGRKTIGKASIKESIDALVEDALIVATSSGRLIDGQPYEDPDTRQPGGDDFDLHERPIIPPGFREGDGTHVCATCPHFARGGIVEPNHFGACMLYTWPVDRLDVCDDWTTLTPEDATVVVRESALMEAEAAGDTDRIVVARAHLASARAAARAVTDRPLHPAHKDRAQITVAEALSGIEEAFEEFKHPRGRGGKWVVGMSRVGRTSKIDQRITVHADGELGARVEAEKKWRAEGGTGKFHTVEVRKAPAGGDLVPHHQLSGRIDLEKEIQMKDGGVEKHYRDENGNRSVVATPRRSAATSRAQQVAQDRSRAVHNKGVSADEAQIEALVARRVGKGNAEDQSREMIRELLSSHDGDNLVHALVHNGFATASAAQKFVNARKPGSKMSRRSGHDLLTEVRSALELPDLNEAQVAFLSEQAAVLEAEGEPDEILGVYVETLLESELSSGSRAKLDDSAFALPGRRYPIHDEEHAKNALARVSQHGSSDEKAKVRAAVKRRYPNIEVGQAAA